MKEINFLPARYRERQRLRRDNTWRFATLAVALLVVVAIHLTQAVVRSSLRAELGELSESHTQALEASRRLEQLRQEATKSRHYAELFTYLDHPWPRTQLLAAVIQTLPQELALADVRIVQQSAARPRSPEDAAEAAKTVAVRRDLQALRSEFDSVPCEVIITGIAADTTALHSYVAGFTESAFFASAKLESIESLKEKDAMNGSRFELRLIVRPGYGQAGGPASKSTVHSNANQSALHHERHS